ncbi:MAG: hypothetical protein O7E57_05025 [Gammaproteobacteria bacterium]|nr:hypothetical protein [Gammaproteobacteria bacterium]
MSDKIIGQFLVASGMLGEPEFGLEEGEVAALAPLARCGSADWAAASEGLGDAEVIALIRLFTLAEEAFALWDAGAKSPVIPLAAQLKKRGVYPDDLTAWIKAHTGNRFLPYGSLLDRL